MLLLFAVSALMAAVGATTALAEKPVLDPDCTFEKGETTCVKTALIVSISGSEPVEIHRCGSVFSGYNVLVYRNYQLDTFRETTTVYKGKSDNVVSSTDRTYQTKMYTSGSYYNCSR